MKRTTFLTLVLLFAAVLTQAQTEKTLKIYMNGYFQNTNSTQTSGGTTVSYENLNVAFTGFTPAIMLTRESGRYTEYELSSFRIYKSNNSQIASDTTGTEEYLNGSKGAGFAISGRYEYGFNLKTLFDMDPGKLSYILGLSAQPSIVTGNRSPYVSDEFRWGSFSTRARVDLIPRIMYSGNGKWFVDLNFPISLMDGKVTYTRRDDPSLPLERQRYWIGDASFFPLDIQARIGVGVKI